MTAESLDAAVRMAKRNGWHGRLARLEGLRAFMNAEDEAKRQAGISRRRAELEGRICPMCRDRVADEPGAWCVRCDHLMGDSVGCK